MLSLFFQRRQSLLPLFPQSSQLKSHLNSNQDDNDPFQVNTVFLAKRTSQNRGNLLCVIHLLVERLDTDAHIKRFAHLVIVTFESEFVPTIPEQIR